MRPVVVKVYGNLSPVNEECYKEAVQITEAWNLYDVVELNKDLLLFSYEGEYFPCDEIVEVLKSYHNTETQGKLDCINLEEWTLSRHFFNKNEPYRTNTASLDHAIDKAQNK